MASAGAYKQPVSKSFTEMRMFLTEQGQIDDRRDDGEEMNSKNGRNSLADLLGRNPAAPRLECGVGLKNLTKGGITATRMLRFV